MNHLQLLSEIEHDLNAEQRRMYDEALPSLKALGWIKSPDKSDLIVMQMYCAGQYRFSMARVVTGARRKWRKMNR